jgi:hypothetical protein
VRCFPPTTRAKATRQLKKLYTIDIQHIMHIKLSPFHSWCLLSHVLWVENTAQRLANFISQKEDQQRHKTDWFNETPIRALQ